MNLLVNEKILGAAKGDHFCFVHKKARKNTRIFVWKKFIFDWVSRAPNGWIVQSISFRRPIPNHRILTRWMPAFDKMNILNEPEIIVRPRSYNYAFQTSLMNKWSSRNRTIFTINISTISLYTFEHVLNRWELNQEWGKAVEKMRNRNV